MIMESSPRLSARMLRIYLFFVGLTIGMIPPAMTGLLLGVNADVALHVIQAHWIILGANLFAFILAFSLARYWSFRRLGQGLGVVYLGYLVVFAAVILPRRLGLPMESSDEGASLVFWQSLSQGWSLFLFAGLAKAFMALVLVYAWALINRLYSFPQACWHYIFFSILFAVGAGIGGLIAVWAPNIVLQGEASVGLLMVATLVYLVATWVVTSRIPEATETPLPSLHSENRWGLWTGFIIPLTLTISSMLALSSLTRSIWLAHLQQNLITAENYPTFLANFSATQGIVSLLAMVLSISLVWYLRSRQARAWTVIVCVLMALALVLQILSILVPLPYMMWVGGAAVILTTTFFVGIFKVLALMTYTVLPQNDRYYALIWVQLLLVPFLQEGLKQAHSTEWQLALAALLWMVAIASVSLLAHRFTSD